MCVFGVVVVLLLAPSQWGPHVNRPNQTLPHPSHPIPPTQAPGQPLWGVFCSMPFTAPAFSVRRHLVDPRPMFMLALLLTFSLSASMYIAAVRALAKEHARLLAAEDEEEASVAG